MSKIPRIFATPTVDSKSKLPTINSTSTPVEVPKFVGLSGRKPAVRSAPLQEITTEKNNKSSSERCARVINSAAVKRNASSDSIPPPNKQVRLAPKHAVGSAKIPPYDYKARYNDLVEKHKVVKTDYTELKEKFEDYSDEMESMKDTLESTSTKSSLVTEELEILSINYDKLTRQYEELTINYESKVKINEDLTFQSQGLFNEVSKLKGDLTDVSLQLTGVQTKLESKNSEYENLKASFENEVQKCAELSSMCEENRVKILAYTSELTFLNTRQKIIDQKNDENTRLIANLRGDKENLNSEVEKLTSELSGAKLLLEHTSQECKKFILAYELELQKNKDLTSVVSNSNGQIAAYQIDLTKFNKFKDYLELENENAHKTIHELQVQSQELQQTIESMHESQKKLRNELIDLKGHIRVFCRIRPSLAGEASKQLLKVDVVDCFTMEIDKSILNSVTGITKKQKHNFVFDGIFSPQSTQREIFSEVSSLIQSAMDGYNVCIFAYGQTGSGKTYTMDGASGADCMGIIPRAINMIFDSIPSLNRIGWQFTITASFLEIYNENIYDLLDSNKDQDHSIKMVDSKGNDVYVSNLREETVNTTKDLLRLLSISQKNRQTAATMCNDRSSRSHSVSKIKISAFHELRKEKYVSNLNLVDLAGSESAKTSQRMEETRSINKSLSELSKVILALQSKQSHIPYRNSKLTYLLMPSLGGNSKTLMLVNIAQLDECYQETVNSLRFAAKVNSCRNGLTRKNISAL